MMVVTFMYEYSLMFYVSIRTHTKNAILVPLLDNSNTVQSCVADTDWFDTDTDLTFYIDANPDPTFYTEADPDPYFT